MPNGAVGQRGVCGRVLARAPLRRWHYMPCGQPDMGNLEEAQDGEWKTRAKSKHPAGHPTGRVETPKWGTSVRQLAAAGAPHVGREIAERESHRRGFWLAELTANSNICAFGRRAELRRSTDRLSPKKATNDRPAKPTTAPNPLEWLFGSSCSRLALGDRAREL